MYVPIVRKIKQSNDVLIERALPQEGQLVVKTGDFVEPFTKMGMTKVSYGKLPINKALKLAKGRMVDGYFYKGDLIGKVKGKKIIAPFDGTLEKSDLGFVLRQQERDYWLLAGVWGQIVEVVDSVSVLINAQTMDFSLAACTGLTHAGELIVFPNPSELLEMQYLEKFAKDVFGKIIYTGNFASTDLMKRATEMGVGGVIAGSADKSAFTFAKQSGTFLGVFSGFGHIPTPEFVYVVLKEISNRYVFVHGERQIIRIPVNARFEESIAKKKAVRSVVRLLKEGMRVQVLERPYFGWVGKVDSIQNDDVYVKLDETEEVAKVRYPNIILAE